MKVIKTEQLVEKLNKLENKYIVLALEGNIEEEIHMKIAEVNIEENYIKIVYDKASKHSHGKSIQINIHQIKKIETDEDIEFYIHLDGEQRVLIFTDEIIFCNYITSRIFNK